MRDDAPQLRTTGALIAKHEQIQDALEREAITGKQAEQMNQTVKGILNIAKLEVSYWNLVHKFGRTAPVPRSPVLRSLIGLPEKVSPTDAAVVQRELVTGKP